MYKTTVNNNQEYALNNDADLIVSTNEVVDIIKNKNGSYTVTINNEVVVADIIDIDEEAKLLKVKINQQLYTVAVNEPADILVQQVGVKINTEVKVSNLKSGMPGLVLKVLVKEGDVVKKGDVLLVVEAMKMENLFKASADAKIGKIKVNEKDIIEKGQELITFL